MERYHCPPRRPRNLVNVALTYERLLADYSYSSERPFKRKSDGVCNFHVRLSLPPLPFLLFLDGRLGRNARDTHAAARSRISHGISRVCIRLVSSSRLISSRFIVVSFRSVPFCSVRACACCKGDFPRKTPSRDRVSPSSRRKRTDINLPSYLASFLCLRTRCVAPRNNLVYPELEQSLRS